MVQTIMLDQSYALCFSAEFLRFRNFFSTPVLYSNIIFKGSDEWIEGEPTLRRMMLAPLSNLGQRDDSENMTPKQQQRGRWLLAALRNERVVRALELIHQGADLSVRDSDGRTALYAALVYDGCKAVVNPLLKAGADPNTPTFGGTYPIHVAAEYGGVEAPQLLEALISYGACIDVRDEEGATAIFLAGKIASAATIQTLQRHGANISDRNNQLDTALTFACCWGMTERALTLLDAGIDLEAQDDTGMTALHWAARDGHASTVALLLGRGAHVDVSDQWGRTALMYAAAHGSRLCVARLLEARADPVAQDAQGQTALDAVRRYAGRDLTEALLAEELPGDVEDGEPVRVERLTTPDGESAVRIGTTWWTREFCDGFDAIVALLQQRPSINTD